MNVRTSLMLVLIPILTVLAGCQANQQQVDSGWIELFDGKTLNGWSASENQGVFTVEDGMIKVEGKRSHLFYSGEVVNHNFKNFELMVDVKTLPNSNSGIYIHTEYQQEGWPRKGYETQINNSHRDWKRTSSLYDVVNIKEPPAKDGEWFTQHIIVNGKNVIVKTDGKVVVDYIEADDFESKGWPGRRLSSGTVAFQAHDPGSVVYYKNIRIKPLP
jgi:3-keto-disaccharide hydrolase